VLLHFGRQCQTKEGSKLFKDHFKVKLRCRCSVVDQIGGNKNESGIVLSPPLLTNDLINERSVTMNSGPNKVFDFYLQFFFPCCLMDDIYILKDT
jgi:hypothetical protein